VQVGRLDDALRHADAAAALIDDPRYDPPPFGYAGFWIGTAHIVIGRPDRWLEWCQADIDRTGDPLVLARTGVAFGLVLSGRFDEAMALASDVVTAAEAANNPSSLAGALLASGFAFRLADPLAATLVLRRGLSIARDSGNRYWERYCTFNLAALEAQHRDPRAALDLFTETITGFHDVGDTASTRNPMIGVAVFFDRIGRHEPAAIIAGYATNPFTHNLYPELAATTEHLRDVLGDDRYTTLTRQGETMSPADAVRYTLAEIGVARADEATPQ
jgi:hypothetical protein